MNRIDDYKKFLEEKEEIINKLRENKTLMYDLFHPVLLVLNFLVQNDTSVEGFEKRDLEALFNDGYTYLYNALDIIDEILKKMLFNNVAALISHDKKVYYILKFDELAQYEGTTIVFDEKINYLYKQIELNKKLDSTTETELAELISNKDAKEKDIQNRFAVIGYYLGLKLL